MAFIYVLIDLVSTRDPMRVAFTYLTFSSHTAYWRMIIWEYGMAEVFRHPLFGIGFEEWERPSYMYSGSMDNFWLVIAVRHGIPAFLGFCLIAAVPVIKGFRKMAREGRAPRTEAYMFALSGLVVSACTVHYWLALLVFFTFFCGMAPGCLNDEPQWEEPAYDD
jgi:O-antigen ligase